MFSFMLDICGKYIDIWKKDSCIICGITNRPFFGIPVNRFIEIIDDQDENSCTIEWIEEPYDGLMGIELSNIYYKLGGDIGDMEDRNYMVKKKVITFDVFDF